MKLIVLIVIFISYLYYLLKRSKNNFFEQKREVLADKLNLLIKVLEDYGIDTEKDKRWLDAYYHFQFYPNIFKYDGATIVKDLHTINNYDAPAGNHDFGYILIKNYPFLKWIKAKIKLDYQYANDMTKLKVPFMLIAFRYLLLCASTPFYPIFKILNK